MRIALRPIGEVPRGVLEDLAEDLKGLGAVTILEAIPLDEGWLEPNGQCRGESILDAVAPDPGDRVLAVTAADLRYGTHDYVFGLGRIHDKPAVVSFARLAAADPRRTRERLAKEAIHELGHTLDAANCPNRECVMSFSSSVEAVDRKTATFCGRCRPTIEFSAKRLRT